MTEADDKAARALRLHAHYRGKIQTVPKCWVRDLADFAVWYTPGVAAPCLDIRDHPERVFDHTNRGNTVAIVSDGTRVLGLGDIGPAAALPVMEGKALLFKYLGGVDAVPICLDVREAEDIVRAALWLAPSFGGINLEDIAQPKCFRVLEQLRRRADIPVWHDDQQGSATALLAGLINALAIVGKPLGEVRIAMIGMGAANAATYRLLKRAGIDPAAIRACDTKGLLHRDRDDIENRQAEYPEKWAVCVETNPICRAGGIAEALAGADVCIAFARPGPGVIRPEWIKAMASRAVVFACANPVPEIWPQEAKAAGAAIVATGRSDYPNQVNNSLVFPGVFRGVLDVRARTVSDTMAIAAAEELAALGREKEFGPERILPRMDDIDAAVRVAASVGLAAQEEGHARIAKTRAALIEDARTAIEAARAATAALMREGLIAPPPA